MYIDRNYYSLSSKDKNLLDKKLRNIIASKKFINSKSVNNFEKKFSRYLKIKYTIGYSSASTAISALVDIFCKKDFKKEIVIPAFSPLPVVMAIKNFGYKVKFVDVDKDTFLIDTDKTINSISKRSKVIMPVHLFGNVVDIKKLRSKLRKNVFIIEDSSQSHFSKLDNINTGSKGDASVFSFYPTKNLGAYGDAGAITTNNLNIANTARAYRNYGLHPTKNKIMTLGNNFRMDEIQAEILSINLNYVSLQNKKRNLLAKRYIYNLKDAPIKFQKINKNVKTNYHVFAILVEEKKRNRLYEYLKKNNVNCIIYYEKPLPFLFEKNKKKLVSKFKNSYSLSKKIIALPISPYLTFQNIDFISEKIRNFFLR